MKNLILIIVLIVGFNHLSKAQQLVLSKVTVETEINGVLHSGVHENTEIILNPATQEFAMNINLLPALVNTVNNDTVFDLTKYNVALIAKFPFSNLDFFNDSYDNKSYKMVASVTLNGISKEYDIDINLIKPAMGQFDNSTTNANYYPGFAAFVVGIKPSDFNLDKDCNYFQKEILINVEKGIMNKTQNGLATIQN